MFTLWFPISFSSEDDLGHEDQFLFEDETLTLGIGDHYFGVQDLCDKVSNDDLGSDIDEYVDNEVSHVNC
jgi:hypothetical protein